MCLVPCKALDIWKCKIEALASRMSLFRRQTFITQHDKFSDRGKERGCSPSLKNSGTVPRKSWLPSQDLKKGSYLSKSQIWGNWWYVRTGLIQEILANKSWPIWEYRVVWEVSWMSSLGTDQEDHYNPHKNSRSYEILLVVL